MSTGLYIHRSRKAGEIVDAPLYNTAHHNQLQNDIPTEAGGQSDNLAAFRATIDPAPAGVATPVADVGSEIEQIRFVLQDIKTVLNGGVPPTWWYTAITPNFTQVQAHGAHVFRSTNQSIPIKTITPCIFDTVQYDTGVLAPTFDPFFAFATPTRLNARVAGLYLVTGFAEWNNGATSGDLALFIRRNGTQLISAAEQIADNQSLFRWQQVEAQYFLNQNDYVELCSFQTMGGPNFTLIQSQFGLELLNAQAATTPQTLRLLTISESGNGAGSVTSSPGFINCPATACAESFVNGTVVALTAAATSGVFTGWTGDVVSTNNPVNVTMSANKNITATFSSPAAHFTVSFGGPSTVFVPTNVNTFTDLGSGSVITNAVGNAQRLMPCSIVVEQIFVEVAVALSGGQSCDVRLNVGGVGNNGIVVHLDSTGTSFNAVGSVTLNQDDLVCWEVLNFVGATQVSLASISMRYHPKTSSDGFLLARDAYSTVGVTDLACFSASVVNVVNARAWVPKQVTVDQATIVVDSATGAATATSITLKKNDNATTLGSTVTLSDPATAVRGTVGGVIPAGDGAVTTNEDFQRGSTGAPAAVNARNAASYFTAAPDAIFSFYNTGRPLFNHTTGAGTVFLPIFGFSPSATPSSSESGAQMRWPAKGKFKYFAASGAADAATTVTVTLRVAGADTALVLSFTGASTVWTTDLTTEVSVNAGDYVSIKAVRSGAGTQFLFNGVIGFEPT